jgi:phage terminase Nu1 subunit (DNA packaging protein)
LQTGWGGAREGAGGKPAGYVKSDDQKNLDKAKARHESVKADLAELEFRRVRGELVSRAMVKQASATALATLAQALRTIPDTLERKHNITPELAEMIGKEVDDALDAVADMFEMMTAEPKTAEGA